MHDPRAAAGEVGEVADAEGVAGTHQDHERREVDDAAVRQGLPASARDHAGVGEPVRVALEREEDELRGNSEDDLVRDRSGAGERGYELDVAAALGLPAVSKRGKDPVVHRVGEDAETVEDDRRRLGPAAREGQPGPGRPGEEHGEKERGSENAVARRGRAHPASLTATTCGGYRVRIPGVSDAREFRVWTVRPIERLDITKPVEKAAGELGLAAGALLVSTPHTTAAVTVGEAWDPDVTGDIERALAAWVPEVRFDHGEGNSPSHFLSEAIGTARLLPVEKGKPCSDGGRACF